MDTFRVRLNCVDHYQSAPTDLDPPLFGSYGSTQRSRAPTLPVIRVFGATETGQKVCAHIHGALPYLYIEYRGSLERADVSDYIERLRASIDHALAVSYRRNPYDGHAVFVAHVTLVKGVPFFGYHVGNRFFLKIYLLNPLNMTRFTDLLHQGAIMKQVIQPFEAHLQYLAQWMIDFNLFGCANIECSKVRFRYPVPDYLEMEDINHKWHDRSIPADLISDPNIYPRQSHCPIEVDICVQHILNRGEVELREIHSDFMERFKDSAPDEKLVHSLAGLWRDETIRRKRRMGMTDPSSSPFPPEVLISMSADPRDTNNGDWIHEQEYRDLVEKLIEAEANVGPADLSFETFVKRDPLEHAVQTTLESVEDLFPERLRSSSGGYASQVSSGQEMVEGHSKIPISDESNIQQYGDFDFLYDYDEYAAHETVAVQNGDGPTINRSQVPKSGIPKKSPGQLAITKSRASIVDEGRAPDNDDADIRDTDGEGLDLVTQVQLEGLDQHAYHRPMDKKRKLETADHIRLPFEPVSDGVEGEQRPRSRHARFEEDLEMNATSVRLNSSKSRSPKRPKRDHSAESPSNSQKSQASIDADANANRGVRGFQLAKPGTTQNTKSGKNQKDIVVTAVPDENATVTSVDSTETRTTLTKPSTSATTNSSHKIPAQTQSQILQLANEIQSSLASLLSRRVLCYGPLPPRAAEISSEFSREGLPSMIYQNAYYSNERDAPERARDYAGREFKLESVTTPYLSDFDPTATSDASTGAKPPILLDQEKLKKTFQKQQYACNLRNWDIAALPPSYKEVEAWACNQQFGLDDELRGPETMSAKFTRPMTATKSEKRDLSQVEGPTQRDKHGFKFSQKRKSTSVRHETQYMSTMSLEVHVNTRTNLSPDPEHDEVACVFWCIKSDEYEPPTNEISNGKRVGVLALADNTHLKERLTKEVKMEVEIEETELDLLNRLVDIVREFDPDVLTGFEVHNNSWGYLIERGRIKYEFDLCDEFSRMKSQSHGRFGKDADRWGFEHTSTVRVTGRHMINIWRAMRSEINLLQYTMENVVFHLLHKRIPHYSFRDLSDWYTSKVPRDLAKCIEYFISRVQLDLDILDANELIPRTSEQARLIGVDFFSVFSRGSQFKVESFMFRIAKPENFLLVSPSRKQVGQQNALECLPLVMEPQSDFYTSPLLVLDFQSLYPSIMIAYNYCYSTCLGRIVGWRGQNKMGFADFKRQPRLLELVEQSINIAPNGLMFVKPEMRKSLLAKMLGEILETRVMVKSGMKVDKDDKTLQQLLNNRQLALKLLANVTYGYTSASFSGRMPCAEIADSIVQTARETLERTIAFIHTVDRWNAEVVYGDTDSLFIYLKGRTKDEAFAIGNEITKTVTDMNPRPIKLKFEKVYHPCVLLAKKRYVGFKYESPNQTEPEFDAKGIETVRRDGTPAEQKIEEKALKLLFRTSDLSQVKAYFQRQCSKIMAGKVSIQDFCFAKEVKLGTYADKGPPPPGALISTKRMLVDPRLEPQYGERVPYVVVTGGPKARLIDRCVAPEVLLKDESAELDAEYYISKNLIPPLERIFNLVGANVRQWYDEMPKVLRIRDLRPEPVTTTNTKPSLISNYMKRTLESYMKSSHCVLCRTKLETVQGRPRSAGHNVPKTPLCWNCRSSPAMSLYQLRKRLRASEANARNVETVCRNCASLNWAEEIKCDSKDCSVFYTRVKTKAKEASDRRLLAGLGQHLEDAVEELEW